MQNNMSRPCGSPHIILHMSSGLVINLYIKNEDVPVLNHGDVSNRVTKNVSSGNHVLVCVKLHGRRGILVMHILAAYTLLSYS